MRPDELTVALANDGPPASSASLDSACKLSRVWALCRIFSARPAAVGCSSNSSSSATPATSATSTTPASTAKDFQVTAADGQVFLSLDGKLPPNWPTQFPVPTGARIAGSGATAGSGSAALVAVYTTSQPPADALAFYQGNSTLTTSDEKSVSAGEHYLGSLSITAPYMGSVTVASRSGATYLVITLKNS